MTKDANLILRVTRTCSFLLPRPPNDKSAEWRCRRKRFLRQGCEKRWTLFSCHYWSRRDLNKSVNTCSNQIFTVKRSSNCAFPSWRKHSWTITLDKTVSGFLAGARNGVRAACTEILNAGKPERRNAGTPERRNTKTRNTKLLKPETH